MAKLNIPKTRDLLQRFEFKTLFIEELGWDRHGASFQVTLGEHTFDLRAVAEKRGLVVFLCDPLADGSIPDYSTRRKIETQVAKSVHQHIIIYIDRDRTAQVWQWVRREIDRPTACRERTYHVGQSGDPLIQRLEGIAFSLEEEEALTHIDVTGRVRATFDVDKITKRFYDRFKTEHDVFLKFIDGIPDKEMQRWYASVMINRLMFIYFIQKKGFLDNNPDYLCSKLAETKKRGKNHFYTEFLCALFFKGFAEKERSAETRRLLGDVPYLNGGLFLRHQIEELHGEKIDIADAAFEKLFDFFDAYQWHLDERPLRNDREINPDVLGYIFEKYINQKQMGAYYTKEDITGYISKNTIIPCLFDKARQKCKIAFEGDASVWRLLEEDPDRYLYKAVRHGVTWDVHKDKQLDAPRELLPEIAAGLNDVSKRTEWNKPAPPDYALPTEIWREVVARRKRYEEVRGRLAAGEVRDINDLITYNLDIRQFAQDVITNCEGPDLLRAFWHSIVGRIPEKSNQNFENGISILDPTCGSGAFLFAALNILEPLYDACLDRMQVFLDDLERSGEKPDPKKFSDFRKVLERVEKRPNHRYFVLKSIIINNLFGVDIMEEAVEICKLRLFLKLVAQVERGEQIEPLPDIDFNIRAGNSLVGYATYDDVKAAVTSKLDFEDAMAKIEQRAKGIDDMLDLFRQQQTELGGEVTADDKHNLHERLGVLEEELNQHLASEYAIDPGKKSAYEKWVASHKPLHWFIEFHAIMKSGGFNVIIGNPPYVEYSKIRREYCVKRFQTETCGNVYAFCIERGYQLLGLGHRFGFIVQAPIVSTQRMRPARTLLRMKSDFLSYATFDDRPAKLFDGMHHCRLAVILSRTATQGQTPQVTSTRYHKWYDLERPHLFNSISYVILDEADICGDWFIPKFRSNIELSILHKVTSAPRNLGHLKCSSPSAFSIYYKITGVGHWFTFTTRPPRFWRDSVEGRSTREERVFFDTELLRDTAFCCLWSTLHYWLYQARTNCRDFNPGDLTYLPIPHSVFRGVPEFSRLAKEITTLLDANSVVTSGNYAVGGSVNYESFKPKLAKEVFDKVDRVLAREYRLTSQELDFIINYDIKYRMGRDGQHEERQ